ncbi:DoxX family protein [Chitinophaga silvatica]|uniref:DoxX family protein n=1 Tax=Chitinophaga silvatica TaxID=2282649 RepID=A0A3E1YGW0_9BACT|nr:DoxX family protein [Chitinophaga silvatica]RFS26616.1 DoxX family protein [Chitinophaga silvatica]
MQSISKPLNIGLWTLQGLLSILFITGGIMKLFQSIPQQQEMYPWTGQVPELFVRLLGVIDLLGGIGIIIPALLKIRPQLTVLAAIGIIMLMIAATVFHISRGEVNVVGFNIVVAILAAVIVWGRSKYKLYQK